MGDDAPKPPDGDDAWIEKVVGVAGNLGFNKMRLRWKLIRWQERRRQAARRREQQLQHVAYAHKTCAECGAVQDKDEAKCTSCGAKLGKRGFQVLGRLGVMMPQAFSMSTVLAVVILLTYARVWVAMGGGFGSPSALLLHDFGARWPPAMEAEPWRLVTPIFLHIGIWHLAFNLIAIATIGPRIEEIYGRPTMLGLFVVTGALANVGALQVGPLVVSAGASGGVMGLIGVAAGYGHRRGRVGRALRDDMLKWCAYTFVFGFFIGADNWAHLFGLLAGAAFGAAVTPENWRRRALIPARVLMGIVGVVGSIAAVVLIFTRQPSPRIEVGGDAVVDAAAIESYAEMCRHHWAGDVEGAVAAGRKYVGDHLDGTDKVTLDADSIQVSCETIEQLRMSCAAGSGAEPSECRAYEPLFRLLPARQLPR